MSDYEIKEYEIHNPEIGEYDPSKGVPFMTVGLGARDDPDSYIQIEYHDGRRGFWFKARRNQLLNLLGSEEHSTPRGIVSLWMKFMDVSGDLTGEDWEAAVAAITEKLEKML